MIPQAPISELMMGFVVTGVSGTLTYRPAVRTMDRPDDPTVWGDVGSNHSTTSNERFNTGVISASPGAKLLIQAGVKVTTAARATIHVIVAVKS